MNNLQTERALLSFWLIQNAKLTNKVSSTVARSIDISRPYKVQVINNVGRFCMLATLEETKIYKTLDKGYVQEYPYALELKETKVTRILQKVKALKYKYSEDPFCFFKETNVKNKINTMVPCFKEGYKTVIAVETCIVFADEKHPEITEETSSVDIYVYAKDARNAEVTGSQLSEIQFISKIQELKEDNNISIELENKDRRIYKCIYNEKEFRYLYIKGSELSIFSENEELLEEVSSLMAYAFGTLPIYKAKYLENGNKMCSIKWYILDEYNKEVMMQDKKRYLEYLENRKDVEIIEY
ncbi:MAG: hypothetical protein RR489_05645 [Clostridia bacterium]